MKKLYKPKTGSFNYWTLRYLNECGVSKNEHIRDGIGLNEHAKNTSFYADRSSYYFGCIVMRLRKHKVIKRVRRGYYKITKKGIESLNK